jgi:hypothetical protein
MRSDVLNDVLRLSCRKRLKHTDGVDGALTPERYRGWSTRVLEQEDDVSRPRLDAADGPPLSSNSGLLAEIAVVGPKAPTGEEGKATWA